MEQGPIFIGGLDRSGKTTLRAFLVSHPRISIPAVGSNMWTYFYGQFGDLGQKDNFERCLEAMLVYKHVRFLNPNPERIRHEFWQGEPTYARLFALFQEHHAEREGKPRWGDQTGLIERYADPIFAAYPNARVIHMIRDPRDRYEASLALWPSGKGRVGGATARWLYSVNLAKRNKMKYPGQYLVIRFEDLVRKSEQVLRKICAFIEEEYFPAMITMDGASDYRAKLVKDSRIRSGVSPLSESYIGWYQKEIPIREIAFMQSFVKSHMAVYGYSLEPIRFLPLDYLLYAIVDYPINITRMFTWLARETLQQNFPGQFGRKPGENMVLKKHNEQDTHFETAG